MSKLVITHKVEDVAKWKSFDTERSTNMAAFASDISSYVDTNGGNSIAVSMTVTDLDGLKNFMQSETCDAIMRKHGVIKPVTVLAQS